MINQFPRRKRIKTNDFELRDNVNVLLPHIDRGSINLPRDTGKIVQVHGTVLKSYSVGTKYGIIQSKF